MFSVRNHAVVRVPSHGDVLLASRLTKLSSPAKRGTGHVSLPVTSHRQNQLARVGFPYNEAGESVFPEY